MIFWPQSWTAFAHTACSNGKLVATFYLIPVSGHECHHMTVAWRGHLTVHWSTKQKQWPINALLLPPSPSTINLGKFADNAQRCKDTVIKLGCQSKILRANMNM